MISFMDKQDCCGCGACAQKCPKQCITLKEDMEGFLYPAINADACINCNLCKKVCPILNKDKVISTTTVPEVYVAYSKDLETRMNSSSGGIFTKLAMNFMGEGGGYCLWCSL